MKVFRFMGSKRKDGETTHAEGGSHSSRGRRLRTIPLCPHHHLGREGFEVIEAIDGLDALQKARDHFGGIDVLVTDQMMPRLGGTDLVCALKAELPELRVLFITGEPIEIVGDRTGWMTAFLRKPCDLADVVVKIRELLTES